MSLVDTPDDFPMVPIPHRLSSFSLPFSPFSVVDGRSRYCSSSYCKLPELPIRLSVLKLDGSCFEIEVMKSATVAEVRQAVEDVFSYMPREGPGKISWLHLWGHFCLMYDGQKLVAETDCIKDFGIRDGVQLQFVRHHSTNYLLTKKRSMRQISVPEQARMSVSKLDSYEEEEWNDKEDNGYDDIDYERYPHNYEKDEDSVERGDKSKWAFFLKRWFPYSRLSNVERMRSLKGSPSRSACGLFGSFGRKIVQFCGNNNNYYSPRDTWRED